MSEKPTNLLKLLAGSFVVWAALALCGADLLVRLTYDGWSLDKYNSPNRSWVWWAVKDFRQAEPPDVVLLGSSLMMAALHGGDATYLNLPQNVACHHRSKLLEDLLQRQTGRPISTFAFALGGQMASDAYALTSTLMDRKRPEAIVYGIAPRDFMDNTLSSPAATETFRYMTRLGGLKDVGWSARTTFWEQAEYALAQASALYEHRLDFVYLQNHYAKNLLKNVLGFANLDEVRAPFPLRRQALLELAEDCGPNDLMIMPYKKEAAKYQDNLDEYKMRYRFFKPKIFEMQLGFLDRMLRLCRDRGTAVYLVNMPLTQENVQLMPPGFYDNYKARINQIASNYGARFVDLNDPAVFRKEYFADSVHMNGAGGMRFFEALSQKLSDISRVAAGKQGSIQ